MRWRSPLVPFLLIVVASGCASSRRVVVRETPPPHVSEVTCEGLASYYARSLHGNPTASGEIYDENALTAAHRTWEFGTSVRVTNLSNGRTVVVRINDRGPYIEARVIDLSYRAAQEIGLIETGIERVRLETID